MSLIRDIFKKKSKKQFENEVTLEDLFRWRKAPDAPLTPEELLELEVGFKSCDGNCPIIVIYKALMGHINWQDKQIKSSRENYDK